MHEGPRLSVDAQRVGETMPMKRNSPLIWLGAVLLLSLAVVVGIVQHFQPSSFADGDQALLLHDRSSVHTEKVYGNESQ